MKGGIFILVFFVYIGIVYAGSLNSYKPTGFHDLTYAANNEDFAYDADTSSYCDISLTHSAYRYVDYVNFTVGTHSANNMVQELNITININTTGPLVDDLWVIEYSNDSQQNWYTLRAASSDILHKTKLTYTLSEFWNWSKINNSLSIRFGEQKVKGGDYAKMRIFDIFVNVSSSFPPSVSSVVLDDLDVSDGGSYIDPIPNGTFKVNCSAVITDLDGDNQISNVNATFYNVSHNYGESDNDNYHYTNKTCDIESSYGSSTEAFVECYAYFQFYVDPGVWNCNITAKDIDENFGFGVESTPPTVRELMAIDIDNSNSVDFGELARGENSGGVYQTVTVYNVGNVDMDLNLEVYGSNEDDSYSMVCSSGYIDDSYLKFDATETYSTYADFTPANSGTGTDITNFDLQKQTSGKVGTTQDVRLGMGIPASGVSGSCSGTLMFTSIVNK